MGKGLEEIIEHLSNTYDHNVKEPTKAGFKIRLKECLETFIPNGKYYFCMSIYLGKYRNHILNEHPIKFMTDYNNAQKCYERLAITFYKEISILEYNQFLNI
jgi:hypothetical protein